MLTQPVPLPRVEGHSDGNNGLEGGVAGGDGNSSIDRLAGVGTFAPWYIGGRRRADYAFEGLDVCPRIVGCEARNRAVDQLRMGLAHLFASQTQAAHYAGPEVLQHNVRSGDKSPGGVKVGSVFQVQVNASFSPVPSGVGRSLEPRPAGRVHLDDVRPLVCQQHSGQGPRHILPEIDNLNPI